MRITKLYEAAVEKGRGRVNDVDAQRLIQAAREKNKEGLVSKNAGDQELKRVWKAHQDKFEIGAKAVIKNYLEPKNTVKAPQR